MRTHKRTTTLTSREFNQDSGKAKKAAEAGPVIITDRGRPAHVLLTFADYKRITVGKARIADLLAMPGAESVEIEIATSPERARAADLS